MYIFQRIILELKNVQNDVYEIGEHVQRMEDQMTSMLHMMDNMCRLMISKNKQKQKPKKAAPKPKLGRGKYTCATGRTTLNQY